jgi:hypothetical protein
MAVGDHYIIKVFQTLLGQQVLNVYAYEVTSGTLIASDVVIPFETHLLAPLSVAQSTQLAIDTIEVVNLENPSDFFIAASAIGGNEGGDVMAPFVCYSALLRRASRAVRNGHKRWAGVPEGAVTAGHLESSFLAIIETAALNCSTPVIGTSPAFVLTPKIWRRPKLGPPIVLQEFFGIAGAVASQFVTTQNTRKIGRGS